MASSQRLRRVNQAIRQTLAEAIARELNDPRLQLLTVTDVRATPDVKEATIFFTVLDPARRARSQQALESARGVLQGCVARTLGTRHTPHLSFVYDEHQDRAAQLTRLIDEVAPRDEASGADG